MIVSNFTRERTVTIYHKAILVFVSLSLLFGCADRERSNPLDPANPDTGGKPADLSVSASRDTVRLRWQRIQLGDVTGIQVHRRTGSDTEFAPLVLVPPSENQFTDTDVTFGVDYAYQISAIGIDFESSRSEAVQVEPGPTFNWVGDNPGGINRLLKLSHDSRHIVSTSTGFLTAIDIEAIPDGGQVWVLDFLTPTLSQAIRVAFDGTVLLPLITLRAAADAAVVEATGELWVADSRDSTVFKYSMDAVQKLAVSGFAKAVTVGVDQRDGSCWVGDQDAARISKIDSSGQVAEVSPVGFGPIKWLAVNSRDGSVWVTDGNEISKLDESGNLLFRLGDGFSDARKLAVNDSTGAVWVADWGTSAIIKYSDIGVRLAETTGFTRPADLSVNLFDNTCLVADTENHRLVKISADGQSQFTLQDGLSFPSAVDVQNASE